MRREADGREEGEPPRRPAPRYPPAGLGAVRSRSTPGQKLPDRALPASSPLPPRSFPALWPWLSDPFLSGALGPPRSWRPQNPSPGAGPGLSPAPLPGGRGGSLLCPLRPGVGMLEAFPQPPPPEEPGYRPRLPAFFSIRDSAVRAPRHCIYQGPRNAGPLKAALPQRS